MARRAFFSFQYKNDVWRAFNVRNSWIVTGDKEAKGFVDAADFEKVEKEGNEAIKKWIREQLTNTSVTVVLIGTNTTDSKYVKYELEQSFLKGNGMLGIYIHQIEDRNGNTSAKGDNKFGEIGKDANGNAVYFSINYPCYDWKDDNGRAKMSAWIEEAAKKAGR